MSVTTSFVAGTIVLVAMVAPVQAQLAADRASAEIQTVRIAKQFDIAYLPLLVMEDANLLEQHARKHGLEVKIDWLRFSAGVMNDALLSERLDFAAGGIGPMLTIWAKTQTNVRVKGVAALNSMPLYLVTTNPKVTTIKDFTAKDRIALPGAKSSMQAITLQIAAEKVFGNGQQDKLDRLTVSMGHADAVAALLGGQSEINSYFGSSPFQEQALADLRVRKVLDSYDVFGGPHTFNAIWATSKFAMANPTLMKAFLDALEESMNRIKSNPASVAALWVKAVNSKLSATEAEKIIRNPQNEWTTTPRRVFFYLDYMNRAGFLTAKAGSWKDIFFSHIHGAPGN